MRQCADQIDERERARRLADESIIWAGAKTGDRVTIIGSAQIDLLVEFVHRGFANVACRAATGCPHAADLEADLVIAPALHDDRELMTTISQIRRCLRSGGTLLVQTAKSMSVALARSKDILQPQGFAFVGMHRAKPGMHTACFRKLPVRQIQAA